MAWKDEDVELLRRLLQQGKSFNQCLAHFPGKTRSALIGMAHRKHLTVPRATLRPPVAPKPRSPRKVATLAPVAMPAPAQERQPLRVLDEAGTISRKVFGGLPPAELVCEPVTLADLQPHHCRWPMGYPGNEDFRFCGAHKTIKSYCEYHANVAYDRRPVRGVWKEPKKSGLSFR